MPRITNEEKSVNSFEFNERDILNEIFISDNYLSIIYTSLISKVSNKFLKDKFNEILSSIKCEENEILNIMFRNGWVSYNTALEEDISNVLKEAKNFLEEL